MVPLLRVERRRPKAHDLNVLARPIRLQGHEWCPHPDSNRATLGSRPSAFTSLTMGTSGSWSRDRTGDLRIMRPPLIPTELSSRRWAEDSRVSRPDASEVAAPSPVPNDQRDGVPLKPREDASMEWLRGHELNVLALAYETGADTRPAPRDWCPQRGSNPQPTA